MTTHKERFEAYLKERISAGGEADRIISLANAYQGADSAARSREFAVWLGSDRIDCDRCKNPFRAASETRGEDDEVLCQWCSLGRLGLSLAAEPMPGWQRTWSR